MGTDVQASAVEAADEVDEALVGLLRQGVQAWSPSLCGELEALAQVAHHGKLTAIERQLVALRTLFDRYLARDPDAGVEGILGRVARLRWSIERIREADSPAALEAVAGKPRRSYEALERVEVVPVAMRPWRTESDFVGVSVTFWAPGLGRRLEGSVARPASVFGEDPRRLAMQWVSEAMMVTLQELAHGAWALEGVRVSADGRLSFPRDAVARPSVGSLATALAQMACADGRAAVERLAEGWLDPWGGATTLVYLEHLSIGSRVVDDTRGLAWCEARDHRGERLRLVSGLRAEHRVGADNLRHLGDPRFTPDGLVAEARLEGDELVLQPVTAVYHREIERRERRRAQRGHLVHLGLEDLSGVVR